MKDSDLIRLLAGLLGGLWALSAVAAGPLVDSRWLAAHLADPAVLVVDVRMDDQARQRYAEGHVPGAVFTHYLEDGWLSERDGVAGMLPETSKLEVLIGDLGVDESRQVVLVPADTSAAGYAAATRIYWTLKVLGHEQVSLLDGGLPAWSATGQRLERGEVEPEPSFFEPAPREDLTATLAGVAAAVAGTRPATLLDTRDARQLAGLDPHPWVRRAGAVPGARGVDPAGFIDPVSGRLAPLPALAARLREAGADPGVPIVTYCNTGHFASLSWFVARELLGRDDARLYDGSLVEWSADAARPMAAGWAQAGLDRAVLGRGP